MGYQTGKTYWIVPVNNTNVALSVSGNSQVSQNRNVFLWTKQTINDQLWLVTVEAGYARIKTQLNTAYALNIYLSTSNCDIHTWSNNVEDSKINFRSIDAANNIYRIQNYRNEADNNLYLTAGSAASNGTVTWQALNSSNANQKWKLIEYTGSSSGGNKVQLPCKYVGYGTKYVVGHYAVDLDNALGTPIYAWCDGVISRKFVYNQNNPNATGNDTLGNCLFLHSLNPTGAGLNVRAIYAHLDTFASGIVENKAVKKGDLLGTMGSTGYSTGSHLHFALQESSKYVLSNATSGNRYENENWANPNKYLPGIDSLNP